MLQFCNLDKVMEPETIGKNGASPKSLTSKRNFLKRVTILLVNLFFFGGLTFAQSAAPMKIMSAFLGSPYFTYDYPEEYQEYLKDYIEDYIKDHPDYLDYSEWQKYYLNLPQGNLTFRNTQNPFLLDLDIQVIKPVKVIYSLYTYKKTFPQDGKRNYMQGIWEPSLVKPLTTQADIDNCLDKIYEFPVVMETASGYKELTWDGYTDPKFTGKKYPIRDCLYITAHDADTGELIDMHVTNTAEMYAASSAPGIMYRIDEQKDSNGKVVKETLSGTILLAYPDNWPIKKLTALIMDQQGSCDFGALTFDVVNQGAEAIVADINRRISGGVVAHITLTNPTVYPDNPNIKVFEWKDIKGEDGKDFIPDMIKNPWGNQFGIIIEMDEMTYTGLKNGYVGSVLPIIPPMPKSYTDIEHIEKPDIKITSDKNGFIIFCPTSVFVNSYVVYDLRGKALKTGNLSGLSRETITATELRSGVYFMQLTIKGNGDEKVVTKKVIIQ